MPRIALTATQRRDYKVRDFKGWVVKQMKLNHKRMKDVAEVLGLSVGRVSQMLKIEKNGGREADPFSYGQVLILCEFFNVSGEERQRLLTL